MSDTTSNSFSFSLLKNEAAMIYCNNKLAKTLKGKEAQKFLLKIEDSDSEAAQLLMAKTTGQFKFGNEGASAAVRHNKSARS